MESAELGDAHKRNGCAFPAVGGAEPAGAAGGPAGWFGGGEAEGGTAVLGVGAEVGARRLEVSRGVGVGGDGACGRFVEGFLVVEGLWGRGEHFVVAGVGDATGVDGDEFVAAVEGAAEQIEPASDHREVA